MKKHQFKPFEHVLVRYDGQSEWTTGIYSRIGKNVMNETVHVCAGGGMPYKECIPYNKETAYLLGTTKPYKEPEPKVWKITCHKNNQVFRFTNDEFKRFIESAVINNKDIQWFTTTYDENNS